MSQHIELLDRQIIERLSGVLNIAPEEVLPEHIANDALVADTTKKFLIHTKRSQCPQAFVLISAVKTPQAIKSGYDKLCALADSIGEELAQNLLKPMVVDNCNGLAYSISAYHRPLHTKQIFKQWDNWRVSDDVIDWLIKVAQVSKKQATDAEKIEFFIRPLRSLQQVDQLAAKHKELIEEAIQGIENKDWEPCFVNAHNDLWRGNILKGDKTSFLLIDWDGVTMNGYAFYDLVRVTKSFNISQRRFKAAVESYCQVMHCQPRQAQYYLLSAFAFLYSDLGGWQFERFLALLNDSIAYLDTAIG